MCPRRHGVKGEDVGGHVQRPGEAVDPQDIDGKRLGCSDPCHEDLGCEGGYDREAEPR